ncbi:MAG: DUF5915 domain-containing protein, partial [Actinomycetota bacterium]
LPAELHELDLAIDEDLRLEGLARELVRAVQDARKAAGLAVGDRIALAIATDDAAIAASVARHGAMIADETLARTLDTEIDAPTHRESADVEGSAVGIALRPA